MDTTGLENPAIQYTRRDSVVTITLNRVATLNAFDLAMCQELYRRLVEAAKDPHTRAVIITGSGRAFCAGGDLRFARDANPEHPGESFLALTAILHSCIMVIRTMSKPVIAAVNGPAAGAGLFLALACDMRVMAETAYLKQSNTSYGLTPPAGGTFLLPRLVGLARALELVLLDEPISAPRALELGLVNRVAPAAELLGAAARLADRAAQMPLGVIGRAKRLLNESLGATLGEQLRRERAAIAASANSWEGREGVGAFLEKRRPAYTAVP